MNIPVASIEAVRDRITKERESLIRGIDKLSSFLSAKSFSREGFVMADLDRGHLALLDIQLAQMKALRKTLDSRINHLNVVLHTKQNLPFTNAEK
jgi:hypothetical protein